MNKSVLLARLIIISDALLVIIIILVLGKLTSSVFNAPAEGVISSAGSVSSLARSAQLKPLTMTGSFATFSYPSVLERDNSPKFSTPLIAVYDFSRSDIESWNLDIDILYIPSGQLSDNNAFQLREADPASYQESELTINSGKVYIMTDKSVGGFSKVAFLSSGQYQATVSLSGDDINGLESLQSAFNMVLNSWHWII